MSALRRWWPWLRRVLLGGFLLAVAVLLWRQARTVEWPTVLDAVRAYPAATLLAGAALAAGSYALYCSFDVLAKHYVGHRLASRRVLAVAFVAYAFNLNMGALIGGAGFRYRLYSQRGLEPGDITRVLGFSVFTNWSGYLLVLGCVLATRQVPIPPQWELGATALQWVGGALVVAVAGYLALSRFSPRRALSVRGHRIELPPLRTALAQVGLSSVHWLLMGGIVHLLLQGQAPYPTVLGVLMLGAVAGAITHVPAGLGVLEAVFVLVLGASIARPDLLAALLTYRALYYLGPLLLALLVYLTLEMRSRGARARAAAQVGRGGSATRSAARGPSMRA